MNSLAYIIAVLNPLLLNSRDVTVRLGPLYPMAEEVSKLPSFPRDAFKNNGYQRLGNKGVYLSQNLRDLIFNGIGDPNDEGFILKLDFTKLDKPNDPEPIAYILQRQDLEDVETKAVDNYLRTQLKRRLSSRTKDDS